MEQNRKPIVILGPMESESEYLIEQLNDPTMLKIGAYRYVSGRIDGYPVIVGRTYIGMVNAATATALAIERFDPLTVIIQGTSGAHDPALHQGDIILGENIVELGSYYTSHREPGEGSRYTARTQPGAEILTDGALSRVNVLHSEPRILEIAAAVPYPHGKVRRGTIGAADIWNRELDMIAHLHSTLSSDCEEMEGFAVAQVCAQMGVPCADIRIISNSEWHEDEPFDESYGQYCQEFCLALLHRMIDSLTTDHS